MRNRTVLGFISSSCAAPCGPSTTPRSADAEHQSLEAIEREHIIATLRKTRGVVEGPHGAAQLLEMNPSTVRFRMKKLSIGKADYLTD